MTDGSSPEGLPQGVDQPTVRSSGRIKDVLTQNPNALELDIDRLQTVAESIRTTGLTTEQMLAISNGRYKATTGLQSQELNVHSAHIQREGGDIRSFNRGAILAFHFIDQSSAKEAPTFDLECLQFVRKYVSHFDSPDAARSACDALFADQHDLSQAFNSAFAGLPKGTDRDMARYGAGYFVLGKIAATQFGESGVKD